ncbi:glycosyltransferase [Vagococcus fluvialis]
MSTYNGEKYLEEQLNSIFQQKGVKVSVLVRDDGSSDSTLNILEKFKELGHLLDYYIEENVGACSSFLRMLKKKDISTSNYDYYAFSDQDDIWLENKLYIAVNRLETLNDGKPKLYYGSAIVVNNSLVPLSNLIIRDIKNKNDVLFRNRAQGSTMVFNEELKKLIIKNEKNDKIIMHDWWINLISEYTGTEIIKDKTPYLMYRQHENNVIGVEVSNFSRLYHRIQVIFSKSSNERLRMLVFFYEIFSEELSDTDDEFINRLINYQQNKKILFDKNIYMGIPFYQKILTFIDLLFNKY